MKGQKGMHSTQFFTTYHFCDLLNPSLLPPIFVFDRYVLTEKSFLLRADWLGIGKMDCRPLFNEGGKGKICIATTTINKEQTCSLNKGVEREDDGSIRTSDEHNTGKPLATSVPFLPIFLRGFFFIFFLSCCHPLHFGIFRANRYFFLAAHADSPFIQHAYCTRKTQRQLAYSLSIRLNHRLYIYRVFFLPFFYFFPTSCCTLTHLHTHHSRIPTSPLFKDYTTYNNAFHSLRCSGHGSPGRHGDCRSSRPKGSTGSVPS